jgi:hypothetical protein
MNFKDGYQPGTNIVKNEKGDFITDSYSILARWSNHFSQLVNVYGASDVRRQKNTQQSHWCLSREPVVLRWPLKS